MTELENYFNQYRRNIIGIDQTFTTQKGRKPLIYADWTASGRLYRPIEHYITEQVGPFIGNPHTDANITGTTMTNLLNGSYKHIKKHVNATEDDVLICEGAGMTGVINKFQRILGLRGPQSWKEKILDSTHETERPVVFITHMEHHSNQVSWEETICKVIIVPPGEDGGVSPDNLEKLLQQYKDHPLLIGSFSACSNVTGILPPIYELARRMHKYNGLCFADYAASAPYVNINMHPENKDARLDAIFFSPHKFLGGPGSCGVLLFNKELYHCPVPDHPGGGTVIWTNPWGEKKYIKEIEMRESGGTPGFLQVIKTSLVLSLKESMSVDAIFQREREQFAQIWDGLTQIENIQLLAPEHTERLNIISFVPKNMHHHAFALKLNEWFGIQVRSGCSCAGSYGHYLLGIDKCHSEEICKLVESGHLDCKPGWVRVSLHPTTTNWEIDYIIEGIRAVASLEG